MTTLDANLIKCSLLMLYLDVCTCVWFHGLYLCTDAVTGSSRCYKANLDGKFYGYCGGNPTDGYIPCEEALVISGSLC